MHKGTRRILIGLLCHLHEQVTREGYILPPLPIFRLFYACILCVLMLISVCVRVHVHAHMRVRLCTLVEVRVHVRVRGRVSMRMRLWYVRVGICPAG